MKLLHIDSSILGPGSVSRKLSAAIADRLKFQVPDLIETYRDLGADPLPHLSGAYLMAAQTPGAEHPAAVKADLALGGAVLQEFLTADVVVVGVAFYNFGIPSSLKAWVDRIMIAGQTFSYGADGRPVGLAGDKRVILGISRGGYYGPDSAVAAFEHAETYLRVAFSFMGIAAPEVVIAEGVAVGPEQRNAAIAKAEQEIAALAA